MQETSKPDENSAVNEETCEKQSKPKNGTKECVKTNSTPLKEVTKVESELKTKEKASCSNQFVESDGNEKVQKNQNTPEQTNINVTTNSTPLKERSKTGYEFKTPEKSSQPNQSVDSEVNKNDTPTKPSTLKEETSLNMKTNSTPLKELKKTEYQFKTPEKSSQFNKSDESKINGMPGKIMNSFDLKLEQTCDGEDGMISTTEQARLLIAASKTPSKSVNKTPVKQHIPSGRRSLENSPVTPGKHRRVELITLASPKAKRLKQI